MTTKTLKHRLDKLEQVIRPQRFDPHAIEYLETLSRDECEQLRGWIAKIHPVGLDTADRQEFERIYGVPFNPAWRVTDPAELAELQASMEHRR